MDQNFLNCEDFYKLPMKVLKVIGCDLLARIPSNKREKNRKNVMKLIFWIVMIVHSTGSILQTIHLILNINDQKIVAKVLPTLIHVPEVTFKFLVLYKNRQKLREIFIILENLFPKDNQEQKENEIVNFYSSLMKYQKGCIGISVLLFSGLFFKTISESMKTEDRELLIEMWMPFDTSNDAIYLATCFHILILTSISTFIAYPVNLIFCSITSLISLLFHTLKNDIKKALNNSGLRVNELKVLINRHNELIDLVKKVQSLFSIILLSMFVVSSMVICVTGYETLIATNMTDSIMFSQFSFVVLYDIIPVCYFCHKIIDTSESLIEAINESNWYEIKDAKIRKMIPFMIQKAQKISYLSGNGFVIISRSTISSILTSSYSYMAMLRHLLEK
ncbi:hypothetical protein PVAND_013191 [Polypedilum vanderplanki]|uniref:Odorant receptor n=1 Tax=Polypedilum vanderplanki TaxID=319348 RepID=A0A9J6CPY0_POLVA|nr:hypothetical protein PVAND_013191 [Polypedilum vanderplanki]